MIPPRIRISVVLAICLFAFVSVQPCVGQRAPHTYAGQYLQRLEVPIGGIGTGNIQLGGRGDIAHLEIFNRPSNAAKPPRTFFAIRVQPEGGQAVTRVLERELLPPYENVSSDYLNGLPRFKEVVFEGKYPFARLAFQDEAVPVEVSLEAYNPFIPLDPDASGMPLAVLSWTIHNPTDQPTDVSIVFSMQNPLRGATRLNEAVQNRTFTGVRMSADGDVPVNMQGDLLIATTASDTDLQTRWYRGGWIDNAHIFWDDFTRDGRLDPVTDALPSGRNPDVASLLAPFRLEPGESRTVPFYLTWYFPKRTFTTAETFGIEEAANKPFSNYYGKQYSSATDVLQKFLATESTLYEKTKAYADLLFGSTYPDYVLDALATQTSTIKTNLIHRTEEGLVHGFEGVLPEGWCCPGTCTHVWNYEQTLASLFPSLERTMRDVSFLHDTFDSGFQAIRSVFPLGDYWFDGPPAADGHMGNIVRVYREWKLSGDTAWLRSLWPKVKKALEYAWYGPGTVDRPDLKHQERHKAWDPEKRGILTGEQHNTYDINFYGPSSMTGSLYLAALKAASEMAEALGETDKAREYLEVYERGRAFHEEHLWNGEYFIQIIEENPNADGELSPPDAEGRVIPKYQYGDGSLADQLLGQYLAHISGLGYILDPERVDEAMASVFKYNFMQNSRAHENVQRVYTLNDEAGVVLCAWPNGNRPLLPFVYSDEVWTGVEFQVAASLIYSGHVEEGLRVVEAVQARHDGLKRNPYAHHESGWHYARAMASWSVLLALSGFEYDGVEQTMGFSPRLNQDDFRTFWSGGSAWGGYEQTNTSATLSVAHGALILRSFTPGVEGEIASVTLDGNEVGIETVPNDGRQTLRFPTPLIVNPGQKLQITFRP